VRGVRPQLDILPPAQRALWPQLGFLSPDWILYGGTAIALQLGHRESVDFDFFGWSGADPEPLLQAAPFAGARVFQRAPGTLSFRIDGVQVSFFAVPRLGRVRFARVAEDTGLHIADLLDLAALKCVVVQRRAEAKDYLDLAALLVAGIGLPLALSAARGVQGADFSPEVTLKALSHFEDGDLRTVPRAARDRLARAVAGVNLDALPELTPLRPGGSAPR